jgi:hypothetical protein
MITLIAITAILVILYVIFRAVGGIERSIARRSAYSEESINPLPKRPLRKLIEKVARKPLNFLRRAKFKAGRTWIAVRSRLLTRREGEAFLNQRYLTFYGKDLNLSNPERFSERLFHRMIMLNRHGNRVFTRLSDKLLVREYVRQKIGRDYLVDLFWHGLDPNKIPFDTLPSRCVAKTNHGCGYNMILEKPVDRDEVVKKLEEWMKSNYYWENREYQYYHIKPQILIERYLDDEEPDGPLDYRLWCFGGQPEVIQVDNHEHSINPFYDVSWKKLPLHYRDKFIECDVQKPANLAEMIMIASGLSSTFDFVRVDLYNVRGKIYFGELTFTPVAGLFKLKPESWDAILGEKWPRLKLAT